MPIVYKTVTYAINIDLAEEGLEPDASDDAILDAAEAYTSDSWDELSVELEVEAVQAGPVGLRDTAQSDDDDVWGDDDGEDDGDFAFDDEGLGDDDTTPLPETPDDSEDY